MRRLVFSRGVVVNFSWIGLLSLLSSTTLHVAIVAAYSLKTTTTSSSLLSHYYHIPISSSSLPPSRRSGVTTTRQQHDDGRRPGVKSLVALAGWYGRGSDIWPPTNVDFPVQLQDSFPGGRVPTIALDEQQGKTVPLTDPATLATIQRRGLRWISFIVFSITMGIRGVIGPMDVGAILLWSFYSYLLIQLADSGNGVSAVPAGGHVPHLVRNPLGRLAQRTEDGKSAIHWDAWVNFVLPMALVLLWGPASEISAEEWYRVALGRPLLWWMTVQVADDIIENSNNLESSFPIPLPIQYWIRLSSRVSRWALLTVAVVVTQWPALVLNSTVNSTMTWSLVFGFLPALHWVWSTVNIFGYWIPVASMKYMRAHWISTEAETLTIQPTAVHHYARAVSVLTEED